jgi:hypothetical protein
VLPSLPHAASNTSAAMTPPRAFFIRGISFQLKRGTFPHANLLVNKGD